MKFYLTINSNVGSCRMSNEDMVLANDMLIRDATYTQTVDMDQTDRIVVAVADGMGGYSGGEIASYETVKSLKYFFADLPSELSQSDFIEEMNRWFEHINDQIIKRGNIYEECKDMGTTIVAFLLHNGHMYSMNCGDSRLYVYRDGVLSQLTTDHSLGAKSGKHSNMLTNCIGANCHTAFVDITDITNKVQSGDVLLLCSDGLYEMIDNDEIRGMLEFGATVDMLVEQANFAGGYDNVSVCMIRVE